VPNAGSSYLAIVVVLAVLLLSSASAATASTGDQMLDAVNGVRVAHHLRPLRPSASLSRSSSGYARYLMSSDQFAHAGRIPGFRRAAEVLEHHTGRRATVGATLRRWLASPGHRAILLDPSFRYMGVGWTTGVFAGRPAAIWVGRLGG
jgi:uncharacterized protein YkwD